jgi:type I restriction-modification system DNA methylase subunit
MNPQQARAAVAETFPRAFCRARFLEFTRNLLNRFDETTAAPWNTTSIKAAFKSHVNRFERLGTYTSPDGDKLDVLIVRLADDAKLERARTALRNFVADHLKNSDEKDSALVAFVPPDERQWRFSYVKMEYAAVVKETGKIGVETRLTPARRFSYIVGEGESCHTAQSRFLSLLGDTVYSPSLAQLEDAFGVEAVTEEFFNQYAALFGDINAELERLVERDKAIGSEFTRKNISTVDFAKKLMGQIVFLYFLQKKGWLGVEKGKDWGTGPHGFLRRLAQGNYGAYENFFNDILEPLFYDILADDRGHEAWCNRFKCRIPFLNGGLFEPLGDYDWKKTDIILPNKLFTNSEFIEEGITGTGVLDVFDRYNFTVNEAEPLEKEVAIDPEMLGKVFENLIEENRRKGLGSYYTPREIVHYMCQESLINYLDATLNIAEESIARAKPVQTKLLGEPEPEQTGFKTTVRREIVPRADIETFIHLGDQAALFETARLSGTISYRPQLPKSIEQQARLIDEKLVDITVCDPAVGSGAFPVGMMTEIVRARSALTPYFNDVHDRTPYHFKRHAIQNSLYGVDIDPGAVEIAKLRLWLSLVVDEEDVKQIKPLPNLLYKIVAGNSLLGVEKNLFNRQLFSRLEELKPRYFDEPDKEKKDRYKQQIEDTIHELTNGKEAFDFEIYFSEVFHRKGGFDVVIGNPPYLNVELISRTNKEYFARAYKTFYKRSDVFGLFFELGLTTLVQNGTVAFIVPQQIANNLSYRKLRDLMLANKWLHEVLYLGDKIFESASNDVCVLFLWKPSVERIRLVHALDFENRTTVEVATDYFKKFNNVISFSADAVADGIFDKLFDAKHEKLRGRFEVFQGIVTGNNTAFLPDASDIRSARIEKELLHPVLHGRDFEKWFIRRTERRILYVNGETNIKAYPRAEQWLSQFKAELKKRRECQNGVIPWFSLQWPRDQSLLDRKTKIVVQATRNPRLKLRVIATLDEDGIYGTQGLNFIVPKRETASVKYVLGLLNSMLVNFLYATKFLNVAIKAEYLKDTPIAAAAPEKQKAVERLVERILTAKRRDAEADVSALEREIDQLVYALYGLTADEIKIVEESASDAGVGRSIARPPDKKAVSSIADTDE